MYIVTVTNDKTGQVIRTRHFTSLKRAEEYEDRQYRYNPVVTLFTIKIEKQDKATK